MVLPIGQPPRPSCCENCGHGTVKVDDVGDWLGDEPIHRRSPVLQGASELPCVKDGPDLISIRGSMYGPLGDLSEASPWLLLRFSGLPSLS